MTTSRIGLQTEAAPWVGVGGDAAAAGNGCQDNPATALLFIRESPGGAGGAHSGDQDRTERLGRWRRRALQFAGRSTEPALERIEIADLRGRLVVSADLSTAANGLRLPAGTYHVTMCQGELVRRYTVALAPGARFDLRLPAAGPGR